MRLYSQRFAVGARAYSVSSRKPTHWYPGRIDDAEAFCRKALDDAFDSWGMFLRSDYYDDALQDLIIILQRLERKFDLERCDSFERYASWIIPQRAVDVGPRSVLGRNGSRTHQYLFDELDQSDEAGGFAEFESQEPSRELADWREHDGRIQAERDRRRARAIAVLGI